MIESLQVIESDVYSVTKEGAIFLGENPMTKEEVSSLQEEIKFLEKTRVWSILTNTLAYKAKEKMFENATTFEDMRFGKAMLFNITFMKTLMKQIKALQPIKPKVGDK